MNRSSNAPQRPALSSATRDIERLRIRQLRRRSVALLTFILLFALRSQAAKLPGFGVQQLAMTTGFCSSLSIESNGVVYYTTTSGDIFRLDSAGASAKIAHVPTQF